MARRRRTRTTCTAPGEKSLWQITNPGARDFRLCSIGPKWKSTVLPASGPNRYVAIVPAPKRGFTAYMIELTYPSGIADAPFRFTTGVKGRTWSRSGSRDVGEGSTDPPWRAVGSRTAAALTRRAHGSLGVRV